MKHFGHTFKATYLSAPIDRQGMPETLPPNSVEKTPKLWKPPFPEEFCSEKVLLWKPKMEDPDLKLYRNRPVCRKIGMDPIGTGTQMNSLDAFLVPITYRCVRNPLHARYTPGEWQSWNNTTYTTAGSIGDEADRIMKTGAETRKESQSKVQKVDGNSKNGLFERLSDIHLKKNELNQVQKALIHEVEGLTKLKNLVDEILDKLQSSLLISEHCLFERDKRQSVELAHDSVEKALVCEVDTMKTRQSKFRVSADRLLAQLSRNRSALHELEMDTLDKVRAMNLDETALHTSKTDPSIIASGFRDLHAMDNSVTDQRKWLESATATIQRCQSELTPSKTLRESVETLIDDTCYQVSRRWNETNKALADRINETLDARTEMAKKLDRINHCIYNMHGNMEDNRRSMDDVHASFQREQKRLDLRYRRPNVEACRDTAQESLLEEGSVLTKVMDDINKDLYTCGDNLQLLQRMKTALEEEIAIKDNTLFIDREKVRAMRKTFPLMSICGIRIKVGHDPFQFSSGKEETPDKS